MGTNTPVDVNYNIDVPLKEDKLDSIKVMMGLLTTEGEKIIENIYLPSLVMQL